MHWQCPSLDDGRIESAFTSPVLGIQPGTEELFNIELPNEWMRCTLLGTLITFLHPQSSTGLNTAAALDSWAHWSPRQLREQEVTQNSPLWTHVTQPVSFQAAKLATRETKQKLHKPLPARSQIRSEWPAARVIKQSGGRRWGPGVFSIMNPLSKKNHNGYPGHSRVGTWKGACRSC